MTKRVLIPLAPGFEEIETITVVDILRRSGARVTLAGTLAGALQGSRQVLVTADCQLSEVNAEEFDLIVLPGGQPGTTNLQQNEKVRELLLKMHQQEKYLAAICAAPLVLFDAGLLEQCQVTSHPSVKDKLPGVNYSEERVVVDGNIITSRGPGTAMEFALILLELLFGKERLDKVNQGVMARI